MSSYVAENDHDGAAAGETIFSGCPWNSKTACFARHTIQHLLVVGCSTETKGSTERLSS